MTQSKIPQSEDTPGSNQSRDAYRYILITAGVMALATIAMLLLFGRPPSLYDATYSAALVCLVALFSAWLSRQGRSELGLGLLIGSIQVGILVPSIKNSGLGLAFAVAGLIMTFSLSRPMKSRWLVIFANIASIAIATVLLALDIFEPFARTPVTDTTSTWIVAGGVILLYLIIVLLQSWESVNRSLSLKIILSAGVGLILLAAFIIGYASISLRNAAIEDATINAKAVAQSYAAEIKAEIELGLDASRTLAQSLEAVKDPGAPISLTREQVNGMLKKLLENNPNFLGTYTLWEPNAFDGLDAEYVSAPAHDKTGRFIPYWVRDANGNAVVEALLDYETPVQGDWYLLPRSTKQEQIIGPFFFSVQGELVLGISLVTPIVVDGQFYGIGAVDVSAGTLQGLTENKSIFGGAGRMVLISNDGTLAGVTGRADLVGKPVTELSNFYADDLENIKEGQIFIRQYGDDLSVFVPIVFGNTKTPWSVNILIPNEQITARATPLMQQLIIVGAFMALVALGLLWFVIRQLTNPILEVTNMALQVAKGNLDTRALVKSSDELGILASTFNTMTDRLRESIGGLESRVAERTAKMERRNLDLALATEIGQTVSQVRDIDLMLKDAAEIIRTFFGLYYVQVYLVNASQTELVLQYGTGAVGAELLASGHRLPLDETSINGRAAIQKRSMVIADTASSSSFRPNPRLPDTRSEIAVPLLVGDRLIGVLDAQSEQAGMLSEEALLAFEPMAGQMAIAIQNARLVAETEQARADVEVLARRLTRSGWEYYLDAVHQPERIGFMFENDKITSLTEAEQPESEASRDILAAPISVTGEKLGALVVEMEEQKRSSQAEQLVFAVARQVSQQIENLRLLENAERYRAEAEDASRRVTREGWQDYMDANAKGLGYTYNLNEVRPQRQDENHPVDAASLSVPLRVRDEIVGKLVVQGLEAGDSESYEIANAVAERLGAHIEGLRLSLQTEQALATTQKLAQREQSLRQITSAVRGSTDPATILRTAVRELGTLLGRKVVVRLTTAGQTSQAPAELVENAVAASENEPVPPAELPGADGGNE